MFNKKTIKKETLKEGKTSPLCGRGRKAFRFYCSAVLCGALIFGTATTAFAANDPISVVNNLSDFIFGLIRAVGLILLGWGIVQVGLSFSSHDPSQRSNGFLTLAAAWSLPLQKRFLLLSPADSGGAALWKNASAISILSSRGIPMCWGKPRS